MKRFHSKIGKCAGFTVIEMMMATMAMVLVGGLVFYLLNAGMVLFSKNTAVNVAHQQARIAVLAMERDLHSAVSIPQLVDANKAPVAGNGPAAGISFQVFSGGPFRLNSTAAAGQNQVDIRVSGYVPKVGQRVNFPLHQYEKDITVVGIGGTNRILTLSANLTTPIEASLDLDDDGDSDDPVVVTCFITDRYSFVVNNGQLRYYTPGNAAGKVLANNITSPTPFSIPLTEFGAPSNRFVAAINLSTADPSSSNRRFKAANMFLNSMVPYRAKLCTYSE